MLTPDAGRADYFERVAAVAGDARPPANWVMGDLAACLKAAGTGIRRSPVSPEHLGELVGLIVKGEISGQNREGRVPEDVRDRRNSRAIIEREGLAADQRQRRARERWWTR